MKVRLSDQFLRFRLGPRDLGDLELFKKKVQSLVLTPEITWSFCLEIDSLGPSETIEVTSALVKVCLPAQKWNEWAESPNLSWEIEQVHPPLTILIEKDLKPHRDDKRSSNPALDKVRMPQAKVTQED